MFRWKKCSGVNHLMSPRTVVGLALLCLIGLPLGCAPAGPAARASLQALDGPERDVLIFETVARYLLESSGSTPLLVDPRPLRLGEVEDPDSVLARSQGFSLLRSEEVRALVPPAIVFPDSNSLAPVGKATVEARRAVLRRLGIEEDDALERPPCPGLLVPPGVDVDRSGCPDHERVRVTFSLPRPGGAYWSGDDRTGYEEGLRRGYWSTLAVVRSEGPRGWVTSVEDLVAEPLPGGEWRIVERVPHLIVE